VDEGSINVPQELLTSNLGFC